MTAARVFISYSYDGPEHSAAVLALANRLRDVGIEAILDQYEMPGGPTEGWPRWILNQVQHADAVLLICSQGFERSITEEAGRGVRWEGSLVFQELYSDPIGTARYIPVVLAKSDIKYIPLQLRAYTFYVLETEPGFSELVRRLTGQPAVIRPALGAIPRAPDSAIRNLHGIAVFLCHSSKDKETVRNLYSRLASDRAKPWLDEEDLLPGQSWQEEIPRAVRAADAVIVCLSSAATDRAGYFNKEIKFALDALDQQPEGSIYLIPVKLEECTIPDRLSHLHCVILEGDRGYDKVKKSLLARAKQLRLDEVS
jgi:hypothetical protein